MRMTTALLAACGLLFPCLPSASAQLLEVPVLTGTAAQLGGLTGAASFGAVMPALSRPSASLSAAALPQALPSLTPALLPQAVPALMPAVQPKTPVAVRPRAVLQAIASDPSFKAAISQDSAPGEKSAALSSVFDGDASAPAVGGGLTADTIQNAYGFYSWLSKLPGMADASYELKARILIAAEPLLAQGPVIAMDEGNGVSVLSMKDPMAPPAKASFEEPGGSLTPQEKHLAGRLEAAAQADAREQTFTNTAGLMNRLSDAVRETPAKLELPERPKIGETREMPLDPVRRPQEYLDRLLRDAMRAEDPFEALRLLDLARSEARRRLNYQDGSRFLERLHGQGSILVPVFVPGLLEDTQLAAAEQDETEVKRLLDAAFKFVEYGHKWKDRVNAAARRAYDTMDLLDEYGPVDEETGQPVRPEDSGEDAAPDQP